MNLKLEIRPRSKTITGAVVNDFARVIGDFNPIHTDQA
jgi:acyl dehydratase